MLSGVMGQTEYTFEPIVLEDGKIICCKATVFNSKDYEALKFTLKKKPDGTVEVMLDEKGVNASDPATIGAQNNAKVLDLMSKIIPLVTPAP